MRFLCKKCKETKDIYKVKFTSDLICKDAVCCDDYMEQIMTDEYKGIPEIKRNDSAIDKGNKLWNDFKHDNTEK